MKKLSYFAKSNIFLLASFAVALSVIWVKFPFQSLLWGILLAVGYYYWGKNSGRREGRREAQCMAFHYPRVW